MCKKLILLVSIGFVLCVAGKAAAQGADPNFIAWWKLDDGSGNIAKDSVGIYNGTLQGSPTWVPGVVDGALRFDGGNDCVRIGGYSVFNPTGSFSVALWANIEDWSSEWGQAMLGTRGDNGVGWCLRRFGSWWITSQGYTQPSDALSFTTRGVGHASDGVEDSPSNTTPPLNEWLHIICVYDRVNNKKYIYFNGVENIVWDTNPASQGIAAATQDFYIGARSNLDNTGPDVPFTGKIDDVRYYDRALTTQEVATLAVRPKTTKADNPEPANGATMVKALELKWTPADVAAFQDVYLGTSATLTQADFRGRQQASTYVPIPALAPLTAYYWRIDAVEADGVTFHTGDLWSFSTGSITAYNPNPQTDYKWVLKDSDLSWTAGVGAVTHDVYLGISQADVAAGTGDSFKGNQTDTAYDPGILQAETTYYWRIDEVMANGSKEIGSVWRFRTMPDITITDPNLVGWWTLDEGQDTVAFDWSGHGNNGNIMGNPQWAPGHDGGALKFDGAGDYVDCGNPPTLTIRNQITMAVWMRSAGFTKDWEALIAKGDNAYRMGRSATTGHAAHMGINGTTTQWYDGNRIIDDDEWHHISGVYDGSRAIIYVDGEFDSTVNSTGQINATTDNFFIGENSGARSRYFTGLIDDVRLYNRAMTQDEVKQVMKGNVTQVSNPKPANGTTTDAEKALPLSWSPGSKAAQHDVYLGTDEFAVEAATASDITGIYRGRQDANSYSPAGGLEFGKTYYWRIDEVNNDATISKGKVWTLIVAPYVIVEDFEQYNDTDNVIYDVWADYFVNNTGMTVGHFTTPYAERSIVQSGKQAMYMRYDNDGIVNEGTAFETAGTLLYSEAERQWEVAQDWTANGVNSLTLWFRGLLSSVGSFTPGPPMRMTAAGADIYGTSDQFHFAYKQLSGDGRTAVKVVKLDNTNPGAKAGIMIRESLAADSAHVMVVVTPGQGIALYRRTAVGATTELVGAQFGLTAPYWVRLTRNGNTFTTERSLNGSLWTTLRTTTMPMLADVYVGLCLTSRNVNATCTAEFSNLTLPNTVTGQWQSQDIGIQSNIAEQLYVVLQDSVGNNSPAVKNSDPLATTLITYTPWDIPLTSFTGQATAGSAQTSVNLQAIKKMTIGVGDRDNPKLGGAGDLYIDDIRLNLP